MGKKVITWCLAILCVSGCHHFRAHTISDGKRGGVEAVSVEKPPRLVLMRGTGVYYAPESHEDIFFYGGRWYYLTGVVWYASVSLEGPWMVVLQEELPQALFEVPPGKFKNVPPGWEKVHGNGR